MKNLNTLMTVITYAYVNLCSVPSVMNIDDIGHKLYADCISERINIDVDLMGSCEETITKTADVRKKQRIREKTCLGAYYCFLGKSDHRSGASYWQS